MRRVIWSSDAREDLRGLLAYIGADNPHAAERYRIRLSRVTMDLAEFSERGRLVGQWVREITLVKPYLIQYAVLPDEVRILSIRHAARRPEA